MKDLDERLREIGKEMGLDGWFDVYNAQQTHFENVKYQLELHPDPDAKRFLLRDEVNRIVTSLETALTMLFRAPIDIDLHTTFEAYNEIQDLIDSEECDNGAAAFEHLRENLIERYLEYFELSDESDDPYEGKITFQIYINAYGHCIGLLGLEDEVIKAVEEDD